MKIKFVIDDQLIDGDVVRTIVHKKKVSLGYPFYRYKDINEYVVVYSRTHIDNKFKEIETTTNNVAYVREDSREFVGIIEEVEEG